jgi:fluoride exporter
MASTESEPSLPRLRNVAWVAAGGAIGGTLRYLFIATFPVARGAFPWVFFVENVVGAFALGVLLTVLLRRSFKRLDLRPFLGTGVLGSFTTFSNLSLDVFGLASSGSVVLGAVYGFGSLLAGLVAAMLGIGLGRRLTAEAS